LAGLLCLLSSLHAQTAVVSPTPSPLTEDQIVIGDAAQVSNGQSAAAFGFWDLLRMLLVLMLVVGAIYGLFFIIKRGKKQVQPDSSLINVLASTALPGGRQIHVIEIGRHMYVLGNADQSVNLIAEISDQESLDEIHLAASAEQNDGRKSFAQLLGGLFAPQDGNGASGSLLQEQKIKLRRLRGEKPASDDADDTSGESS